MGEEMLKVIRRMVVLWFLICTLKVDRMGQKVYFSRIGVDKRMWFLIYI